MKNNRFTPEIINGIINEIGIYNFILTNRYHSLGRMEAIAYTEQVRGEIYLMTLTDNDISNFLKYLEALKNAYLIYDKRVLDDFGFKWLLSIPKLNTLKETFQEIKSLTQLELSNEFIVDGLSFKAYLCDCVDMYKFIQQNYNGFENLNPSEYDCLISYDILPKENYYIEYEKNPDGSYSIKENSTLFKLLKNFDCLNANLRGKTEILVNALGYSKLNGIEIDFDSSKKLQVFVLNYNEENNNEEKNKKILSSDLVEDFCFAIFTYYKNMYCEFVEAFDIFKSDFDKDEKTMQYIVEKFNFANNLFLKNHFINGYMEAFPERIISKIKEDILLQKFIIKKDDNKIEGVKKKI